jgi:hypothetical protein
VAVERGLLILGELPVGRGLRGIRELILAVGEADPVAGTRRLGQRGEVDLVAEQAGLHREPLRLTGVAVQVDVGDRAELLAAGAVGVLASPGLDVFDRGHGALSSGGV